MATVLAWPSKPTPCSRRFARASWSAWASVPICLERNPRLVYGRMTGWGQQGPLAQAAGHDINYISLSGVLHAIGPRGIPFHRSTSSATWAAARCSCSPDCSRPSRGADVRLGQVVDVAMTEGSAYLALACFGLAAVGDGPTSARQFLDGGAPFWRCYRDQRRQVHLGWRSRSRSSMPILLRTLGLDPASLPEQFDQTQWPAMCERFAADFKPKTRQEWCALIEGTDICFAPVLCFAKPRSTSTTARASFVEVDGIVQPGPAPRFSRTPSSVKFGPPAFGAHTEETLKAWGFSPDEVDTLAAEKAIGRQART